MRCLGVQGNARWACHRGKHAGKTTANLQRCTEFEAREKRLIVKQLVLAVHGKLCGTYIGCTQEKRRASLSRGPPAYGGETLKH